MLVLKIAVTHHIESNVSMLCAVDSWRSDISLGHPLVVVVILDETVIQVPFFQFNMSE